MTQLSFTGQLAGSGSYFGNISLAFGPVFAPGVSDNSGGFTMMQMQSPFPPIPGSPWWAITHGLGEAEQFQIADPNSPPNPPLPPRDVGNLLTLLARDPNIPPRLRRFTDQVTGILNSMIRQGVVVQTGPLEWALSLGITEATVTDLFAASAGPHDIWAGPGPAFRPLEVEDLPISGVSAGTYSYPTMQVNQFGIVTAIVSNPTPSGGGGGGPVADADVTFADITTGNVSSAMHGFFPKLSGVADDVFGGDGTWQNRGYIQLEDQKTSGTSGGTCTAGSWQTRTLNTEVVDTHGDCSLSSNQFTLAAGTYEIDASAPAYGVTSHQIRLRNVTDSTTIANGTNALTFTANVPITRSYVRTRFTIAAGKALEIQHKSAGTVATFGFGLAMSFDLEVYTTVVLRRIK